MSEEKKDKEEKLDEPVKQKKKPQVSHQLGQQPPQKILRSIEIRPEWQEMLVKMYEYQDKSDSLIEIMKADPRLRELDMYQLKAQQWAAKLWATIRLEEEVTEQLHHNKEKNVIEVLG